MTSVFVEKALKLAQPDLDAIVVEQPGESGWSKKLQVSHGGHGCAAYGFVNAVPNHPIEEP